MRVIVYGMGAVGGVIAAAVHRAGGEVIGIARGAMLEACREAGLRLQTPDLDEVVRVPVVAHPGEIEFRADDAILLCMKTQDTQPALEALRAAGVVEQPLFCVQNGVENERLALRMFANVHGVTVMMPATYLVAGSVAAYSTPRFGLFDIGRAPDGVDADDHALAAVLEAANFTGFVMPDVMTSKYGKLLMNLRNVMGAVFGPSDTYAGLGARVQAEAVAVLAAAGQVWMDVGTKETRHGAHLVADQIPGLDNPGGSTVQSVLRGKPVETDYLNGEIVLLGRLHGVPTPVNAAMVALAARVVREGLQPGAIKAADVAATLG